MRVAHLARKPLSEGSVGRNVLVHGTGGINVDASRINVGAKDPVLRIHPQGGFGHARASVYGVSRGAPPYDALKGRWPANLVLVHSPGCQRAGKKIVKSQNPGNRILEGVDTTPNSYEGKYKKRSTVGHASPEGTETVEAWECVEGCPVRELDEQSGPAGASGGSLKRDYGDQQEWGAHGILGPGGQKTVSSHRDSGGASRFFKQIKGTT